MDKLRTACADIETTAIKEGKRWMPDRIHMLTISEAESDKDYCFVERADLAHVATNDPNPNVKYMFGPGAITAGVKMLMEADTVVFHNGIGFDFKVLEHYTEFDRTKIEAWDSIVLSRVLHGNIKEEVDYLLFEKTKFMRHDDPRKFHGKNIGKHGLEVWGVRLGVFKGDYSAVMKAKGLDPWAECNPDMIAYGIEDSRILRVLWNSKLKPNMRPSAMNAINIEHYMAELMEEVKQHGIKFNVAAAEALYDELEGKITHYEAVLKQEFPDRYEPAKWLFEPTMGGNMLTELQRKYPKHAVYRRRFNLLDWQDREQWGEVSKPKRSRREKTPFGQAQITAADEFGNGEYCKLVKVEFNPNSRPQIQHRLMEMGWEPSDFTETGAPKTDEKTLLKLEEEYPEAAKSLVKFLLLQKRLGQLKTGKKAWLSLVDEEGFVHPTIIPCSTVTGRGTHMNPNISQVPSVQSVKILGPDGKPVLDDKGEPKTKIGVGEEGKWGWDCRALFCVPEGWKMVGTDLAGIELRCWAHYLWPYDDGALADIILNADIHENNRKILGFANRRDAKSFMFALLYGAGDEKLGSIIEPLSPPARQKEVGAVAKRRFMRGIVGMDALVNYITRQSKRGWIVGLDGRRLPIRKSHAALNTLLQSAGAIISKYWLMRIMDVLEGEHGLKMGYDFDFSLLLWSHDETQIACREELSPIIKQVCLDASIHAGKQLKMRLPITSDAKIGDHWAETH